MPSEKEEKKRTEIKILPSAERSRRPALVEPRNRDQVTAIDCICVDEQSLSLEIRSGVKSVLH